MTAPSSQTAAFTSAQDEQTYIIQRANVLGLDPAAVLAVASHEGVTLPAEVGDHGTSFGPWQLHAGGALPGSIWAQGASYADQWANSQAGIDYALEQMAGVAQGMRGATAITNIVRRFENPADPTSEIAASIATYNHGGTPSAASGAGSKAGTIIGGSDNGGVGGPVGSVVGIFNDINSAGKFFAFITSWRFAEIVGGVLLLLLGLLLLGRQFGVSPPVPMPAVR